MALVIVAMLMGLFASRAEAASSYKTVGNYTQYGGVPFSSPRSVAISGDGKLYVADNDSDRIVIFNPNGTLNGAITNGPYYRPSHLTIRGQTLYACESGTDSIYRFNLSNNQLIGEAFKFHSVVHDGPRGIAVDSLGNIFVSTTFAIVKITPSGVASKYLDLFALGNDFFEPMGIAIDEADNLYFVNKDSIIHRWDKNKKYLGGWSFPKSGSTAKGLAYHSGVLYASIYENSSKGFFTVSSTNGQELSRYSEAVLNDITEGIAVHPTTKNVYVSYRNLNPPSGVWIYKDIGTTTTATVSSSAVKSGDPVTVNVAVIANNGGTATGTVTIKDGSTTLSTVNLVSGQASFTTSSLPVGSRSLTAEYLGDANNAASTSSAVIVNVSKVNSSTDIQTSSASVVFGESVTFTATVGAASGSGIPTGTVTFMDGAIPLGTGTLSGGKASWTVSNLTVGTHNIKAQYIGDEIFESSMSGDIQQTVNKAVTATIVMTSKGTSVYGETVTFTAVVKAVAPGNGTPSGSVIFRNGSDELGSVALSGGSASLAVSNLAVGNHFITAAYSGDSSFLASVSVDQQKVNKAGTETTVSTSKGTSVFGETVTFTANVTPGFPGGGTPTGTVVFMDGATTIGTGTLSGGSASIQVSSLAVGNYTISATYSGGGDGSFLASASTVQQKVNKASTKTTVATSKGNSVYGETVTFTVAVEAAAPGGGTPSGSVTFMKGSDELGSGMLSNGSASIQVSELAVGNYTITVQYEGNGSYSASNGTVQQTVNKAGTATSVKTSKATSVYGETVTFTATVTTGSSGVQKPTGTVKFMNGSDVLDTVALDNGVAKLAMNAIKVGSHTIEAQYSGDNAYAGSDAAVQQTVMSDTAITVTASNASSVYGEEVTFTATVTATTPGGTTPTGTVVFKNGAATLGTGTLSGGSASIQVSLAVGNYTLTAQYSGDSLNTASSGTIQQTVNKAATAITVATTNGTSVQGETVTFTAVVTPVAPGSGTPTGTVAFKNGATTLGTGTLSGGSASIQVSSLAVGSHSITATYSGDGSFLASESTSTVQQTVNEAATATTIATSKGISVYGETVTFTVAVEAVAPGSGTPTGTVTFMNGSTPLGEITVSGGSAALDVSGLAVGSHSITATYSGDSSFLASASTNAVQQTVNKANTAISVATLNGSIIYGEEVTWTVTVTAVAPGSGTPTGKVTFMNGSTSLGDGMLINGSASIQVSELAVGNYTITAQYEGDGSYSASNGTVQQTVNKAGTATSVTTSKATSVYGEAVTFTATVTTGSSGVQKPTGTVKFMNGSDVLDTVTLDNGVATLVISAIKVGSHTIEAQYSGDNTYAGSDAAVQQTVMSDTAITVTASNASSVYGEEVTLTAMVTATDPGGTTPTGTVVFMNGAATLGTGTLSGGSVSLDVSHLEVGNYTLTAQYSGDSLNTASSGTVLQTVNKASTELSVTSSKGTTVTGESVTFTADVTVRTPGDGVPSGKVAFTSGSKTLGIVELVNGVATLDVGSLDVGSHTIEAEYTGDFSFTGSNSTVLQTVNKADTSIAVTISKSSSVYGETVTIDAAVAPLSPGSGVPSGQVTFRIGSDTLDSRTLSGGTGSVDIRELPVGTHTIHMEYDGDLSFNTSGSDISITVTQAQTSATVSSPTKAVQGQEIKLTARVRAEAPGQGTPTGKVTFFDQTAVIGEVTLTSADGGIAELVIPRGWKRGEYEVYVEFEGDAQFLGSRSGTIAITVTQPSSPGIPVIPVIPEKPATIVSDDGNITLPSGSSGKVSLGKSITVVIPAGLSNEELRMTIKQRDHLTSVGSVEGLISGVYEIIANLEGPFKKEITITFVFDPSKLQPGQQAAIFYFDEKKQEWIDIGGTVDGNTIYANVDHSDKFAVFAVGKQTSSQSALSDISGHWGESAILSAVRRNFVAGYSDGTFRPNHPITRAEFTVMLVKALQLEGAGQAFSFVDRDRIGGWAKQAIASAVQAGIVSGYNDGTFRPNARITRAEMAVMLVKALRLTVAPDATTGFEDDRDIPEWAKGAVETIYAQGIVSGRSGNKYAPKQDMTRAEALTVIMRILEYQGDL